MPIISQPLPPSSYDNYDRTFEEMRDRAGDYTPDPTEHDLYRRVTTDTVKLGDDLSTLEAQVAELDKTAPTVTLTAPQAPPIDAIMEIRRRAQPNPTSQLNVPRPTVGRANPDESSTFQSKFDRESFPGQMFTVIESLVFSENRSAKDACELFEDLLGQESRMFLAESPEYTNTRRSFLEFDRNSVSRRWLIASLHEWRSKLIGPFGGGQVVNSLDYMIFDNEIEPRPMPPLPPRLCHMYANGPLVCDVYHIDESMFAICFYRPCVAGTDQGRHQYMGCLYVQSEQSLDHDLCSAPRGPAAAAAAASARSV